MMMMTGAVVVSPSPWELAAPYAVAAEVVVYYH
jgi:hypothetical protein